MESKKVAFCADESLRDISQNFGKKRSHIQLFWRNPIISNGISYNLFFELITPDTIVQYFKALDSTKSENIEKELIKREKRFQLITRIKFLSKLLVY